MSERFKVFKVTLCVVDFDEVGADGIKAILENTRYPNHCLDGMTVVEHEVREVDVVWTDDHPLNYHDKGEAFRKLFGTP